MSKSKHGHGVAAAVPSGSPEAAEYRIIGQDLARVLVLNVMYLAAILVVYFTNQRSHYLEHIVNKMFNW